MTTFSFANTLLHWYDQQGRHNLPWRQQISAYRVWISEVMLQQTQVATVIPYFHRFMEHFPEITHLANASEDEVLSLWTGLGYYSRARNLHRTAKMIVHDYNLQFPDSIEGLQNLPGIGRSTAGAILAIAMKKTAPILDGNVKRVLARFYAIQTWPGEKTAQTQLWQYSESLLPEQRIDDYTQAIMDLGATICTRSQPKCLLCPVNKNCEAYKQGLAQQLPVSKPGKSLPVREKFLLILRDKTNATLLIKRPPTGIWASLWSFPECELEDEFLPICQNQFNCDIKILEFLPEFIHIFSHFKLIAKPVIIQVQRNLAVHDSSNQFWLTDSHALPGGIPAPIKKLLGDK